MRPISKPAAAKQGRTLIAAAMLILAVVATPVSAQSDRDVRKENQTLRNQVAELQRELEAARQQIEALNRRIAELERQLAAGPTSGSRPQPPPTPELVTIDESVPEASPRALFRSMVTSYEEALEGHEIGAVGDRERTAYLREVESWRAKVNRKYRHQIDWHVRLLERQPTPRGLAVYVVAVDPVTLVELGDPFYALIPSAIARRVEATVERTDAQVLQLKGVVRPDVTVDPDRTSSGPFDSPKLIGPFAGFGFSVDAHSLTEPEDEEEGKRQS